MAAIALAIGIAGGQEGLLQGRHDHGAEGMVHHPIAVGGGGDQAPLGLEDLELAVGARGVGEGLQFVLEREEILPPDGR